MIELENFECVLSVITITPMMNMERQIMDAMRILRVIDDSVFMGL